jgi:hypothetical protein
VGWRTSAIDGTKSPFTFLESGLLPGGSFEEATAAGNAAYDAAQSAGQLRDGSVLMVDVRKARASGFVVAP